MIPLLILLLFLNSCWSSEINVLPKEANDSAIICLTDIVRKHFTHEITFVDINSEDNRLLEALHSSNVSVITRNTTAKLEVYNEVYVIQARNVTSFVKYFKNLTKERPWNPRAKMLIVIESVDENNITAVFDELLRMHVNNVLVVNASDGGNIYTYNPFENYGCGRRYDEVVSCGPCERPAVEDFYPNKLVTGLRNCTFRVTIPFVASLNLRSRADLSPANSEIFLLETLGWLEHFNVKVKFDTTEKIANVEENFTVTGALKLIEDNISDVIMGFKALTQARASAFDYFHWHFPFAGAYVYVVAKARNVPSWKYIYIEFCPSVWVLIAITFVIYSIFAKFLIRDRDVGYILMKMWDTFLGHGNAQSKNEFRYILLQWLWFSYLIGCFYQSSLCSFTIHPKKEHQVSSEEELIAYNYKPCINKVSREYVGNMTVVFKNFEENKACDEWLTDLEKVSNSEGLFTATTLTMLSTQWKTAKRVFWFDKPITQFSYAIYVYKGFPMFEKLEIYTLWLRENGLVEKYKNDIDFTKQVKQNVNMSRESVYKEYEPLSVVPWTVYGFGVIMGSVAFLLEIYFKNGLSRLRGM